MLDSTSRKYFRPFAFSLLFIVITSVASPASAQLVINEIIQNPSAVSDGNGEWFELYNPDGVAVDINGWTIKDDGVDTHIIANGGPLLVPAGGYLVLGNNTDSGTNGGVTVAYDYGSWFLSNSADEVVLLNDSLVEIDRVNYDGGPNFPDPTGASMILSSPGVDNNVGANWCESTSAFGDGDLGTPGAANDVCAAPPDEAPSVSSTTPADKDTDVAVGSDVMITFSEDVTAPEAAYDITCSSSGPHSFALSGGPGTFTLNPDSDFDAAEKCTVTVAMGEVSDIDVDDPPDSMTEDYVFTFTTPGFVIVIEEVVINEIIQNPSAVSDSSGEWFELFNPGADPVDINGWTVKDDDFDSFVIANGGPLIVPAGGYLVLGANSNFATNGGVNIDYDYPGFSLSNGADELVLVDLNDNEVDRVNWDGGPDFPDPNGASMSLILPSFDNNLGVFWCEATTPYGSGDRGTPGAANDCPPAVIDIVINEIIQNPSAVSDTNGEWFELFNPTSLPIDINGWTVKDNGSNSFVIDNGGALFVPPLGFVVLGRDETFAENGGVNVDYQYENFFLGNSDDEVILIDADDNEIDRVEYDGGPGFPDPTGASMSLRTPQLDNNASANWCTAGTAFGAGDLGTPGDFNDCSMEIFEIQGNSHSSPVATASVTTLNNSVTTLGVNGFAMQTPTDRSDGDSDTSDGIWVFTDGAPGVSVGDRVDVTGDVVEFFGFTQFDKPLVTASEPATGAVPAPVVFNPSVPSGDPTSPSCAIELECYEGMLIEIPDGTVTSGNLEFGGDPNAEVGITAASSRSFREPGLEYPGVGGSVLTWDGNPEVFELDPDALGLANDIIPGGSSFSATGILAYEFGNYELWPSDLSVTDATLPVPVRNRTMGETTVGSLNLFRFSLDGVYATRLTKLSMYIRNVLKSPDILAVQEASDIGSLQDLADEIANDGGPTYTPHLVSGNDFGGINVGFMVRSSIAVDSVIQFDADTIFTFDNSLLHDRPPLMLTGRYTGNGQDFPIAVLDVHIRSLNNIESFRTQLKRLEQAEGIAAIVQNFQTSNPDVPLIVVGDFNAFRFTDGYVDVVGHIKGDFVAAESLNSGSDLVSPNLLNQVDYISPDQQYSFVFEWNAQTLDHALTSTAANSWVRGLEFGRGNADAARSHILDDSSPIRASDHDGFVLFLMTDRDGDGVADDVDECPTDPTSSVFNPSAGCTTNIPTLSPVGLLVLFMLLSGMGVYTIRRFDWIRS
jgi:endonuclease/exonuclease/phosphatase family metal-dependent hydrolase